VRQKHLTLKTEKTGGEAEKLAAKKHTRLRPIPRIKGAGPDSKVLTDLAERNVRVRDALADKSKGTRYLLVPEEREREPFFKPVVSDNVLVTLLNTDHLFYKKLYDPLVNQAGLDGGKVSHMINLMLLAATRAEALFGGKEERKILVKFRKEWSEVFDALLRS
jgi:hypothetical protein